MTVGTWICYNFGAVSTARSIAARCVADRKIESSAPQVGGDGRKIGSNISFLSTNHHIKLLSCDPVENAKYLFREPLTKGL
jgi:hypothetical protein